jgi:hypothetical protein
MLKKRKWELNTSILRTQKALKTTNSNFRKRKGKYKNEINNVRRREFGTTSDKQVQ